MFGLLLALLSGLSFAISNVFVWKAVQRTGETFSVLLISSFVGTLLFSLSLAGKSEIEKLLSLSWIGTITLAGAGVLHFILGRILSYTSIRLIGANRAAPIFSARILFAALLGIFFLEESVTASLVVAILFTVGGVILMSMSGGADKDKSPNSSLLNGVILALAGAFCWGISPLLVKIGLEESDSPLLATFVSYLSASVVIGISLSNPRNGRKLRQLNRTSLVPIIIAAIAVSIAQALRYIALYYSPINMAEPIAAGSANMFVLPLSFLINRDIDVFNLKVVTGAVAVAVGVLLLFVGA